MRAYTCSTSPFFLTWRKPLISINLRRPISSVSVSSQPISFKPQIPLFQRPPTYSANLSDLKKWKDWAKSLAISVGSTFVNSDDGPDTTLLCRELKWLMEDAIGEEPSVFPQLGTLNNDRPIRLRADLDELNLLWKQRIEKRRPFQYIVGCEHWRDLVLSVEEGVLIPRPETEAIVDMVNDVILGNEGLREGLWADLGTGSGAISIGIGRILGSCGRVIATDLSPVAAAVASYNVQRYGLQVSVIVNPKFICT